MDSFSFLSPKHFVLSVTHPTPMTTKSPLLQVYEFLDPELLPFTLPRLVRSFELPRPVFEGVVITMSIRAEPPPWHPSQMYRQGKPFTAGPDSQVLAVTFDIFQPAEGLNFNRNSYVLFTHHSTLLEGLEDELPLTALTVPWNKWGPDKTRLLPTDFSEHVWVCYMHGTRFVTLEDLGSCIRMLDFNPWPIRQGESSFQMTKSWVYKHIFIFSSPSFVRL